MNKQKMLFPTILMLLFFICSAESLIVGTNSAPLAWTIYTNVHYVLFILLGLRFISVKSRKIHLLVPAFLVIFFIVISFAVSDGYNKISTYMHICTVIANAWLIVEQFPFDKFAAVFEKAIFVMAVYSLVVYVIALVAPQIIRILPVIENIAGNRYYTAGLAIISQNGLESGSLFRSFGVFREPGMFQIFLNISFCIYLFYQKESDFRKITVYILTILSTVSTAGIIAMLLVFIIFTIVGDSKRKGLIIMLLIAAVVLLSWLTSTYDVFSNAMNKLENEEDMSTVARLYSVIANFKIWISYPIFGSGMSVNSILFPQIILEETKVEVADSTNTYMYILSCFGIVPFLIFMRGLYRTSKMIISRYAFLLFLVFLVLLAGENFLYSSFAWIFAFYGYTIMNSKQNNQSIYDRRMEQGVKPNQKYVF